MLLNPTNVLWEDLMLYWLKLILTSDQGLTFSRQKQILRSSHKKLQKQNNEDFFIQLLYAWQHLTPITTFFPHVYKRNSWPTHTFKQIHQSRLSLMSDNLYFYSIPTRNIWDKFTIIRDHLCRFLQPGLISSTTFLKKPDFSTAEHKSYINVLRV